MGKEKEVRMRSLTDHSLGGGVDVMKGDEFDAPESEAKRQHARGWAEYVDPDDAEAAEKEQERQHPERGTGVVHREPRPARARAPKKNAPRGTRRGART